ncbi:MAG: hypothetical protein HND44_18060 [Chloroflexi bacterium]|nr:anti-sigma factor [Ardenticatenaceae bacterium]MBL1130362.1 hypothetical protein [Chloroflexota bacterium]NOG36453.1 hypothetical protein [Chloroflexota bacterium]
MNDMPHQAIQELLAAYALGSLEADEAVTVAVHLETCPACRAELAAYEAVTDMLATAVPLASPPPALKTRLMARTQTAVALPLTRRQSLKEHLRRWWHPPYWRPGLALVVLVLAATALVIWQQNRPAPPSQYTLTATEHAPEATGVITIAADGTATLSIANLPPLTAEQQYQLWLIRDGQRDSGAVFSVNADGSAQITIQSARPFTSYQAFGITIEPAGGSPGPTGDRVLGFNL